MSTVYLLPELSKSELCKAIEIAKDVKVNTVSHGRLIVEHTTTIRIEGNIETKTVIDKDFVDSCQSKLAEFNSELMVKAKPTTICEETGCSVSITNIDLFLELVCIDETGIYVEDHECDYWRVDPKGITEDDLWGLAFRLPIKSEPYLFKDGKVTPELNTCATLVYCDKTLYIREPHGNAMMYYPVNGGHVYTRHGSAR